MIYVYKSVNLQYNNLVAWVDGTNNSSSKCLIFQVLFFFQKMFQNSLRNTFNIFSYFFLFASVFRDLFTSVVLVLKNWCKRSPLVRLLMSRKTGLYSRSSRRCAGCSNHSSAYTVFCVHGCFSKVSKNSVSRGPPVLSEVFLLISMYLLMGSVCINF